MTCMNVQNGEKNREKSGGQTVAALSARAIVVPSSLKTTTLLYILIAYHRCLCQIDVHDV